jgi:hypothetical protein
MSGDLVERYRQYSEEEAKEKGKEKVLSFHSHRLSQFLWLSRTSKLRELSVEEQKQMEWVKHHWVV